MADEAQDELLLDGVLQSKCFERASSLRRLLQYLWKNRCCEISEYAIATEALGRKHDFDSKVDATVRVQIGRLRQFLAKYYETEGALCRRGINIPVGSHQLCVIDLYGEESSPERALPSSALGTVNPSGGEIAAEPARKANDRRRYWLLPLLASSVLSGLIMFALTLLPSVRGGKQGAVAGRNELPVFWKRFIDNGRSTRIVLPAPLFFAWEPKDGGTLMVRDISVNDPGRSEESPQIVELEKRLGKPRQWQNYTVASDTFASLRLARFLDGYGVRTTFSSSTDSPHEIVDHENIVAFGTASSLAAYQTDLDRLSFKMGPHERYVTDLQLPAGSRPRFSLVEESGSREVAPGIIALLPRGTIDSRILLVQGSQTTALISYLTSEEGMRELAKNSQDAKNPFFEAVVLSEVNKGTPIQSRLVAFRPFDPRSSAARQVALQRVSPALSRQALAKP